MDIVDLLESKLIEYIGNLQKIIAECEDIDHNEKIDLSIHLNGIKNKNYGINFVYWTNDNILN